MGAWRLGACWRGQTHDLRRPRPRTTTSTSHISIRAAQHGTRSPRGSAPHAAHLAGPPLGPLPRCRRASLLGRESCSKHRALSSSQPSHNSIALWKLSPLPLPPKPPPKPELLDNSCSPRCWTEVCRSEDHSCPGVPVPRGWGAASHPEAPQHVLLKMSCQILGDNGNRFALTTRDQFESVSSPHSNRGLC
jgi:hypothetical protein